MKYIVFASLASRIAFRHSEYTTRAAAIAKAEELVAAKFATVTVERRKPGSGPDKAELIFEHLSLQPKISAAVIPRSGI